LRSSRAAGAHWWLANLGLAVMVVGFVLRANGVPESSFVLGVGGTAAASGAYIFAFLVWQTLDKPRRSAGVVAAREPLKTM
jgi:hypothetical protein